MLCSYHNKINFKQTKKDKEKRTNIQKTPLWLNLILVANKRNKNGN